jgi:hypothetical protein
VQRDVGLVKHVQGVAAGIWHRRSQAGRSTSGAWPQGIWRSSSHVSAAAGVASSRHGVPYKYM